MKRKIKLWHAAPPPFNLDARPGLQPAVSRQYARWCKEHHESTQEERKAAYAEIYGKLRPNFPSHRELAERRV
jgi:hypothetical protein